MSCIDLPTTAGLLGTRFSARVIGDPTAAVSRLMPLHKAGEGALSFLASSKYADGLANARGAVVLTREEFARPGLPLTYVLVDDPQKSFAEVARSMRPPVPWEGISPLAMIHPTASVDPTARIGPHVWVGEGARIGARSVLFPFTFIGRFVELGEDAELHARVTIYDGVRIGKRVRIFAGAVIGGDGFGYFRQGKEGPYEEMPQVGSVLIEDDVRIGANATIDRATLAETLIQRGTKLDDQVHIGHNADVGQDVIICAQSAVGGSTVIERDCVLGGQVGLGHGIRIGRGARFGGQAGALSDVAGDETYSFMPGIPTSQFMKIFRALHKLPKLIDRVRELERGSSKGGKHDA